MKAIKGKAIIDNNNQIKLEKEYDELIPGERVEFILLLDKPETKNNWKNVLQDITEWTDEDIKPILEAGKALNNWKPGDY